METNTQSVAPTTTVATPPTTPPAVAPSGITIATSLDPSAAMTSLADPSLNPVGAPATSGLLPEGALLEPTVTQLTTLAGSQPRQPLTPASFRAAWGDFGDEPSEEDTRLMHEREHRLAALRASEHQLRRTSNIQLSSPVRPENTNQGAPSSNVLVFAQTDVQILRVLEKEDITLWWQNITLRWQNNQSFSIWEQISPTIREVILASLRSKRITYLEVIDAWSVHTWEIAIKQIFPHLRSNQGTIYSNEVADVAIRKLKLKDFDGGDTLPILRFLAAVNAIVQEAFADYEQAKTPHLLRQHGGSFKTIECALVKQAISNLGSEKSTSVTPAQFLYKKLTAELAMLKDRNTADAAWLSDKATEIADDIRATRLKAQQMFLIEGNPRPEPGAQHQSNPGLKKRPLASTTTGGDPKRRPLEQTSGAPKAVRFSEKSACPGCGIPGHGFADCSKRDWPWFNPDPSIEWFTSAQAGPLKKINGSTNKSGMSLKNVIAAGLEAQVPAKPGAKHSSQKGMGQINALNDIPSSTPSAVITLGDISLQVPNVLIDTGCLSGDFGSQGLMDDLIQKGFEAVPCVGCKPVCSAFGQCCSPIVTFNIKASVNYENKMTCLILKVKIIPELVHYDLIIGIDTIKKYNLSSTIASSAMLSQQDHDSEQGQARLYALFRQSPPEPKRLIVTKESLLDIEECDDEDTLENAAWWEPNDKSGQAVSESADELDLLNIQGSPEFQRKARALAEEFRDIFSTKLPKQPALLPPLELTVDDDKWQSKRSQLPVRNQTLSNNDEIRRQVETLVKAGILQPSKAQHYSQTLVVPKPRSTKKRMCQDFRFLNEVSEGTIFPMPHIKAIFQRLGRRQPKICAVMDLTQGYHQVSVALNARKYTAFACVLGIFEYLRVPFGLKGAPGYFQKLMSTVVLVGLIMFICECYLDDVIVDGTDEDHLLTNLRQVWGRFRQHKMVVNPE